MKAKRVYFITHADERFVERNIPREKIRLMLEKGMVISHPDKPRRKICIYRERANEYYSIVFQPEKGGIFIITAYPSKEWEKKLYKKSVKAK